MGAISPVPFLNEELKQKVIHDIVEPTIRGISSDKMNYLGFVFFGLINVQGQPFVIEYNCRLGDPETEVILPRYEGDLGKLFQAAASGNLSEMADAESKLSAATVIMVSGGYPGDYTKGLPVYGLKEHHESSIVFHAGTDEKDGNIVTSGGRVLAITSWHDNFREAVKLSLNLAENIDFDGKYYRKDIGFDL
jgi:phosphoribosylamine--glycine ligase